MPFSFPGVTNRWDEVPLVVFLGVLFAHPHAELEIVVKEFNTIEPVQGDEQKWRPSIYGIARIVEDHDRKDWVFSEKLNLSRIFPATIMNQLRAKKDQHGHVSAHAFVEMGQEISNALCRKIVIVHMTEDARPDYVDLGTFDPQETVLAAQV